MKKRGIGIASIFYGTGYGNGFPDISRARAELASEGKVNIYTGATEVGQGGKTVLCQIAAEAMKMNIGDIILICEDTDKAPDSGTAAASRQTYNTGNSVRLACEALEQKILEFSKTLLGINTVIGLKLCDGRVVVKGLPDKEISLKDLHKKAIEEGICLSAEADFTAHTTLLDAETGQGAPYWPYTFGSCCVEVEVDTDTGRVRVLRATHAQDAGKAVNPAAIEGQIEGGFVMGMSWALLEDMGLENGRIKNNRYSKYIIPTALDLPRIESIIIECPEATAPFGAKGIGEPVMLPAMPAILNAIYDAAGIRVKKLPASPQEILRLLKEKGERDSL